MIENKDLSPKTQKLIKLMLKHRKQVSYNSKMFLFGATMTVGLPVAAIPSRLIASATGTVLTGALLLSGKTILDAHNDTFRKEQIDLFRSLRTDFKNNPELAAKISCHKYLVVDRKGNIVGKNVNPKISSLAIGRRRFPNPLKSKGLPNYKRSRH
jgi:hypothetical protein